VTDETNGRPLPAKVSILDTQTSVAFSMQADATGVVTFEVDFSFDSYKATASADGYADGSTMIGDASTSSTTQLSLQPTKPHLFVQVVDGSNNDQPVVAAIVNVADAGGKSVASAVTDASGFYGPLTVALGATYNVSATGGAGSTAGEVAQGSITFPQNSLASETLTLTLTPIMVQKAKLIVTTTDEISGKPVSGAAISVFGAAGTPPPLFQGTTDSTGTVTFMVDTGQTYQVTWTLAGYTDLTKGQSPAIVNFPANSTQSRTVAFFLVPSSGASPNARRAGSEPQTGTGSPSPRRGGKVLPAPGR
jgi:subtilisin family serine protease